MARSFEVKSLDGQDVLAKVSIEKTEGVSSEGKRSAAALADCILGYDRKVYLVRRTASGWAVHIED